MFRKRYLLLIFIILIAVFFRFYNFREFQFWGGDEEVMTATLRHIVWDKSPSLIVQNANLGFGLGPFYHYLLAPFYLLTGFNLVAIQAVGSILGVLTTLLVYLGAKEIGGRKLGLLAGFLYASSFFISIFDRRVVHLTLDPIMSSITLLALVKVVNKKYSYLTLLVIPIGFSFHVDPSLIVLVIAIAITLLYFRIPLKNKFTVYGLVILGIFVLPLIAAEVVYNGAFIKPVIKSLSDRAQVDQDPFYKPYSMWEFTTVLGRVFLAPASDYIEQNFFYGFESPLPLFSPMIQIFISTVFVIGIILLRKNTGINKGLKVLWFLTAGFIIGILIYSAILKSNFYQHYYMVYFPIFIVLVSVVLIRTIYNRRTIFYSILAIYFFINLNSLINSSVRYPLYAKIDLVNSSLKSIGSNKFAVYSSSDPYIQSGGWTELYNLTRHYPVKSYWYDFWGWIYQAYSLYPGPVQQDYPSTIAAIYKQGDEITVPGTVIGRYTYKDTVIDVFDNGRQ